MSECHCHHEEEEESSKELIISISRIVIATVIMILGLTIFNSDNYFWVNFGIHLFALLLIGYDVYFEVIEHIFHLEDILDEHLLMSIASLGAFLLATFTKSNDFFDAVMVLTLFQIGEIFEDIASDKSKKAIKEAISLKEEIAHKIDNDKGIIDIDVEEVEVNDILLVNKGEQVPVDSVILSGEGLLDTSSLTGEFNPVNVSNDLEVYSGYILSEGNIKVKVIRRYDDSAINKINELISSSSEKKSKATSFVSKFAKIYTPIIFIGALLTFLIGGLVSKDYLSYLYLSLKVLVVGCPCAVVISVPLAYFASIGLASKRGIIIKGSNYLDKINELNMIFTDKTGTLTKGEFVISDIKCIGIDKTSFLEALYASESLSNHPIGKGIVRNVDTSIYRKYISNYQEYTGKGVSISYKDKDILSGSLSLMDDHNIVVNDEDRNVLGTVIYVSIDQKYVGYVTLIDEVKEETSKLVNYLDKHHIGFTLLSGDKKESVETFSNKVGIKSYHGELFPSDKITYIEKAIEEGNSVGYIGDGVNDAASIRRSDVGFAMGSLGSDIAIDNADVIIMNDNPYKVAESFKIAKRARRVALFNIFFALFIKIGIEVAAIISSILGYPDIIPLYVAVLTDTGLSVVLIINSLLVLYRKLR